MGFLTTGNATLAAGGMIAVLAVVDPVINAAQSLFYDDTTPFVVTHNVQPKQITLNAGQTFRPHYEYTKRVGCKGDVDYRLRGTPDSGGPVIDIPIAHFTAGWPPGGPRWIGSRATIPHYMPEGTYDLVWIAKSTDCERVGDQKATSPGRNLQNESLPIRVTVKPRG